MLERPYITGEKKVKEKRIILYSPRDLFSFLKSFELRFSLNMATAAVQQAPITPIGYQAEPLKENPEKSHDVHTTLFYYKDPGDGSPPAPTYVG
jgi:hypothetical protein